MKRVFLFAICCFAAALLVGHESLAMLEGDVFAKGKTRVYKVVFPKAGFVGAPPSPSPMPNNQPPTSKEHFETRFLKVTSVAKRRHGEGQRALLRVDEIDKNGGSVVEGLYYACVDTLPQGSRVVCRYADDGSDTERTGIRKGIPFPFTCARPPALGLKDAQHDGHLDRQGLGVKYSRKDANGTTGKIQIEAARLEKKIRNSSDVPRSIQWYGSEVVDIAKAANMRILFRETQEWDKADDWLWKKMERFDRKGNLLMRCEAMK